MTRKTILLLLLAVLQLFAAGSASAQGLFSGNRSAESNSSSGSSGFLSAESNYTLRPSDVLRMEVFQEPDMTKEIRVSADGTVVLPLIGRLRIGGMSVAQSQELIAELYNKDFLVNPQVSLLVLSYKEQRVYVQGHVNRPGPVLIPPEEQLTLAKAVSNAGGATRMGDQGKVSLKRDGVEKPYTINLGDILKDESKDVVLRDGDLITIPERRW